MSSRVLACPSVCMCLFFALFYLQKWKDMVGHGRTWEDMIECVLPCLPLSSISDHVFPCPTMSYHVPPCPTMSHHVLPFLEVKKGENRHMHTLGHAWTRLDMSSTRSWREKRQILEGIGNLSLFPPARAVCYCAAAVCYCTCATLRVLLHVLLCATSVCRCRVLLHD